MKNEEFATTFADYDDALVDFTAELVRIKSFPGEEGDLAGAVAGKMRELGFDEVLIDGTGNVVGKVGNGETVLQFDSHMDTVQVKDESEWRYPPFSARIADGRMYGRGSVDMKSALAASVYAATAAKRLGVLDGKTVYVTCTVCEEFCDGESLGMLYRELGLRPDFVVICEPSDNRISLGHKGKAQVIVRTHGISAHSSAPEKGLNAVYEMAEIIQRVEGLNAHLARKGAQRGTVVLSDISCVSASLNAVPNECAIYLDRRMILGETEEDVRAEMDTLVEGKRASWEPGTLRRKSWTGADLVYDPMHAAWKIESGHPLAKSCSKAYEATFGEAPDAYEYWDFSTNAVAPLRLGIPTIGFGPGEYKLAHMVDENCEVQKMKDAMRFYARLIAEIG